MRGGEKRRNEREKKRISKAKNLQTSRKLESWNIERRSKNGEEGKNWSFHSSWFVCVNRNWFRIGGGLLQCSTHFVKRMTSCCCGVWEWEQHVSKCKTLSKYLVVWPIQSIHYSFSGKNMYLIQKFDRQTFCKRQIFDCRFTGLRHQSGCDFPLYINHKQRQP